MAGKTSKILGYNGHIDYIYRDLLEYIIGCIISKRIARRYYILEVIIPGQFGVLNQ